MSEHCGKVGVLTQHIDDEDGPTVGWEFNLGNDRLIWCGELSRRSFAEMEPDHQAAMGNDFGWFIVFYERAGRRVLGKAVDECAAKELAEMIGKSLLMDERIAASL